MALFRSGATTSRLSYVRTPRSVALRASTRALCGALDHGGKSTHLVLYDSEELRGVDITGVQRASGTHSAQGFDKGEVDVSPEQLVSCSGGTGVSVGKSAAWLPGGKVVPDLEDHLRGPASELPRLRHARTAAEGT